MQQFKKRLLSLEQKAGYMQNDASNFALMHIQLNSLCTGIKALFPFKCLLAIKMIIVTSFSCETQIIARPTNLASLATNTNHLANRHANRHCLPAAAGRPYCRQYPRCLAAAGLSYCLAEGPRCLAAAGLCGLAAGPPRKAAAGRPWWVLAAATNPWWPLASAGLRWWPLVLCPGLTRSHPGHSPTQTVEHPCHFLVHPGHAGSTNWS